MTLTVCVATSELVLLGLFPAVSSTFIDVRTKLEPDLKEFTVAYVQVPLQHNGSPCSHVEPRPTIWPGLEDGNSAIQRVVYAYTDPFFRLHWAKI